MGYGIEKRVVLFAAADLADEEDRVENEAGDDDREEDDSEDEDHDFAEIEKYPTNVERDRQYAQTNTEYKKEDCSLPAAHNDSLSP